MVRITVRLGLVPALRLMAPILAVVPTRRKGTRLTTIAVIRRKVLAVGTRRLRVPILRRAAPIPRRAAVTAAVVHLIQAVGEALLTGVVVAEVHMAVAAVLTAIAKISEISTSEKGPPLLNAAGLFFLRTRDP